MLNEDATLKHIQFYGTCQKLCLMRKAERDLIEYLKTRVYDDSNLTRFLLQLIREGVTLLNFYSFILLAFYSYILK